MSLVLLPFLFNRPAPGKAYKEIDFLALAVAQYLLFQLLTFSNAKVEREIFALAPLITKLDKRFIILELR